LIVAMRYDNCIEVFVDTLSTQGRMGLKETVKEQVKQFLSNDANLNCSDGGLEVETLVCEKNPDNTFNFYQVRSLYVFPEEAFLSDESQSSTHNSRHDAYRRLTDAIPSRSESPRVLDFVFNRL
jgi:hypothetical protein